MSTPKRVREPVQVYLDESDRSLLEGLSARVSVPRSEILRIALRRMSIEMLSQDQPGASINTLVGILDDSPDVPYDLAARHDEYLYGDDVPGNRTP